MELNFTVENLEVFLLVFVRVSSFIASAPLFNQTHIPLKVKIWFSFFIAMLVFASLDITSLEYQGIIGFSVLIIKEAVAGLLLGFVTNLCVYILSFSGNLIDMEIGFSMVNQFDPSTNVNTTITATLYTNAVMLIMMVTYMHHYILSAFIESFQLVPLGKVTVHLDLYRAGVLFMADYFIIGFRIILPVFAATLILNVVLGILAKVAPQMNMFSVGMQLKIMGGLVMLLIAIGLLPRVSELIFEQMQKVYQLFILELQ